MIGRGTADADERGVPTNRLTLIARALLPGALLALSAAVLQAQAPDSSRARPRLFTTQDAWRAGAFTLGAIALSTLDLRIARWAQDTAQQENSWFREGARRFNYINETTATVGGLALWGVGRLSGQHAMADVGFHVAEAVFIASAASQLIRGPVGRARPSVNGATDQYQFSPGRGFREFEYRAFPSIHTTSGFAAAAVLSGEAKRRWPEQRWWITPVAYTLAATPGLSRMFLNQHWASDVFLGAFIGTVAGQKVLRANHDINPNNAVNRFFLGKEGVAASGSRVSFSFSF